jgi:hypothetical protein
VPWRELTGGEMAPAARRRRVHGRWDGLTIGDLFERVPYLDAAERPGSLSGQQKRRHHLASCSAPTIPCRRREMPKEAGIHETDKFEVKKP